MGLVIGGCDADKISEEANSIVAGSILSGQ